MEWNQYVKLVKNDIVYRNSYNNYDINMDPFPRFYKVLKFLLNAKKSDAISRKSTLIDFGCHNTQFMSLAKTILDFDVSGVDEWDESQGLYFDSKYYKMNIEKKWDAIINNKYDYISAFELIEHIIDTDFFLKQCSEHLNHKGLLLITTPNINSLRNRVLVPLGIYPNSMEYRNIIHHVRLYNPTVLESQLKEHGFEVLFKVGVSFFPNKIAKIIPRIDNYFSKLLTSLCNNFIIVARKQI